MDLDSIEGLNEVRPSVYRASMKLLSLQKLCYLHCVSVRHIEAALHSVDGVQKQDVVLNKEEVTQILNRMFAYESQDVPGHVTVNAPKETCTLMCRLYNRGQTGCVSAASLHVALIALSGDTLLTKYKALVCVVAQSCRGSVSRSGLRSLLQDLSQVPVAVQEEGVFGSVEAAISSCFKGVLDPTVGEEHVLSWLQSEPRLLLWLPTLYRLSVSQHVSHTVRCHICKTFPITGLRYRCMKCVNLHVCQSCFLTDRQTTKHKTHHPVLEYCTQPTWRESLSMLMHSARHTLLPRRYTRLEAERRRRMMWAEPQGASNRAPPPSDSLTQLADSSSSLLNPEPDRAVSHDASVLLPLSSSSKGLQTEDEMLSQQSSLLTEVRTLQRDKWLLEQELQAWRLAVQSEQGILEDRCSEMEVTVETLRQHNVQLQGLLTQALSRMDTQHASNTRNKEDEEKMEETRIQTNHRENTKDEEEDGVKRDGEEERKGTEEHTNAGEEEEEEDSIAEEEEEGEWREEEIENTETPSPTIHWGTIFSYKNQTVEEPAGDVNHLKGQEAEPQDEEEESIAEEEEEGEWREEEIENTETPSPTIHWGTIFSYKNQTGEEPAGDVNHLKGQEAEPQDEEEEHGGMCCPEKLLGETADRLKMGMLLQTDRCKDRQTDDSKTEELQEAADEVGDSVHHLVNAVTHMHVHTHTDTH